ncbi:MAG: hypothetical protein CMK99_13610 [Pseudomonas sp.]|nr:hypothetical protein [Pseudomonas sp.]HBS81010.1 hypothetical protein [Pseudomonas sp.]|tara:strand:- start:15013 stop:15219 length:207 start_codon:yes stop_codon:yes gene_type:complete
MAFTLEQYNTLKEAIAGGELMVRYADRSVTYRSLDEMIRTLRLMEGDLEQPGNDACRGRSFASFSKGY